MTYLIRMMQAMRNAYELVNMKGDVRVIIQCELEVDAYNLKRHVFNEAVAYMPIQGAIKIGGDDDFELCGFKVRIM